MGDLRGDYSKSKLVANEKAWEYDGAVMTPALVPHAEPTKTDRFVLPAIGLIVAVFFFLYDAGIFHMDPSKRIGNTFPIATSLATVWTVKGVLKAKTEKRARIVAFSVIGSMGVCAGVAGFLVGKNNAYPSDQEELVNQIQAHAREVKAIKAQLRKKREAITEPEQIPSIEPLVASWKENITEISSIDRKVKHDEIPLVVAKILKLMNEALVFDNQQTKNIEDQITTVQKGQGIDTAQRQAFYQAELFPLMQEEQEIEKQRQASNLEQRIKDTLK